jgi:hypothetical protein
MVERAKEYLVENGPAADEEVVMAMTVTNDLRKARRVLRDLIEADVVLRDEDGLLRLANPKIETIMIAHRRAG